MLANKTDAAFFHVATETGMGPSLRRLGRLPFLLVAPPLASGKKLPPAPSVQIELFSIAFARRHLCQPATRLAENFRGRKFCVLVADLPDSCPPAFLPSGRSEVRNDCPSKRWSAPRARCRPRSGSGGAGNATP